MKNFFSVLFSVFILTINVFSQGSDVFLLLDKNQINDQSIYFQQNNSLHKNSIIKITSPDLMDFIWVTTSENQIYYNTDNSYEYTFSTENNVNYMIISFCTSTDSSILYYQEINVIDSMTININKQSANSKKVFLLKRRDGSNLQIDNCYFLFNNLDIGFGLGLFYTYYPIPASRFTLKYNSFPENNIIIPEWLIIGKQNNNAGNFYWLEGKLKNNFNDTLVQNNPELLEYSSFTYFFPPNQIPTNPNPKVTFLPTPHFYLNDPNYNYPLKLNIYFKADSNKNLFASKFYNRINLGRGYYDDIYTSPISIKNGKVLGQLKLGSDIEFIISDTVDAVFGQNPTFWFGKFNNEYNKIKLTGAWGAKAKPFGMYNQLFLSQTNDALPQYPIKIRIIDVQADSIIVDKYLYLPSYNGNVYIANGFPLDSLQFDVFNNHYKVFVSNDNGELSEGITTTVTSESDFNLQFEDKNPPGLNSFQIISKNIISHSLTSDEINMIRFMDTDENEIVERKLYYKKVTEENWQQLEINNIGTYHTAILPFLESGTYATRIFLKDEFGNSMLMTQTPAFRYDNITSVESKINTNNLPKRNSLSVAFPNPFNPLTNINYSLKENGFVRLKVYDILGKEIATLVNEEKRQGNYSVKFNGNNLPSGVYFYTLRVNNFVQSRKMILLR